METIFKYIVYKTINIVNNKIYIGVHKISSLKFDGYIGNDVYINKPSSYKNPITIFQKAVKKYGVNNFKRIILKIFDNLEDALDLERWLVDEQFVKRSDTYNMVLGGKIRKPTNSKIIFVYNENGQFVKECKSYTEASIFIYGNKNNIGNISRAIKTNCFCKKYQVSNIKIHSMKNYNSYKKDIWNKNIKTFLRCPKKIAQYDLNNKLIKIYESIGAVKRAGFTNVQAVLNNSRKQCKGFIFKYYKD